MNTIKDIKSIYDHSKQINAVLCFVLKKELPYILAHPENKIKGNELSRIKRIMAKLEQGYPLQYITKEQYFYGLKFKVNKNTLIPRPETEVMVEEVLKEVKGTRDKERVKAHSMECAMECAINIIDIGTGTGCIPVAIASQLKSLRVARCALHATDVSPAALRLARANAKFHNVKNQITFHRGNLLEPLFHASRITYHPSPLIITANLPYLTPSQIKHSPTIQHEPKLALDGGPDGLKYYKKLLEQVSVVSRQSSVVRLFLEIDHTQKKNIQKLIKKTLPGSRIDIIEDLQGYARVVKITLNIQ